MRAADRNNTLLKRYRRWWGAALALALAVPMLAQVLLSAPQMSGEEARELAPRPDLPRTIKAFEAWPRRMDAFLADHFGFRLAFAALNGAVRYTLASPVGQVLLGKDRWMFFRGDGMVEQSMGLLQRRNDLRHFLDTMGRLNKEYSARGIRFAVVAPPNATSVMLDRVPAWLDAKTTRTEYDDLIAGLERRGVPHADLRKILRVANARQPVYLSTDTHWNRLGALIAFNATVPLVGRSDWAVDPQTAFGGFEARASGDLARMMGIGALIHDRDARLDLAPSKKATFRTAPLETQRGSGGNVTVTGHDGPSVVIIGDSFTEHAWREFFAPHVSRLVWMHHEMCDFVPAIVDAQKPDIVIFAATERFTFCWNTFTPAKGQIQHVEGAP